jgi:hypothetical protein
MPTPQEFQAQDDAFEKQYEEQQVAKQQQEAQAKQPVQGVQRWMAQVGRVSTQQIDAAMSDEPIGKDTPAEGLMRPSTPAEQASVMDSPTARKARDVGAGLLTGAKNIGDAAMSLAHSVADDGTAGPINAALVHRLSPIWDYAKQHIMEFRDAVQVSDPTLSDNLTQGVAQLAIPYAGYSRMVAGVHGSAQAAIAGAITDATALGPHDARFADLLALGQQTEGKLGAALRALGPAGLNSYINYLTDRGAPDTSAYAVAPGNKSADPANWGTRADGSPKGQGFLGVLQRPDGKVSSEISVGVNLDGKETEIPTLVPTLSKEEVDYLMTHEPDPSTMPRSILDKAVAYAKDRLAAGKSPFAGPGEIVNPETEAQGRWKNVLDGFGVNRIATSLLHAAGVTLKQGHAGIRYAMDNGALSTGDFFKMGPAAGSPAAQRGSVGIPTEPPPAEVAAPQKLPVIAQKLSETPPEGNDAIGKALRYVDATTRFARPQPLQKVIGQLASGLDESTPDGAFYKQLFSDLGQHDLKTMLVSAEHLGVADRPTLRGHYNRAADMMAIPPAGMQRDTFLHTIGHESVHAVTMHAVNDSEIVANALSGLANEARIHPEFQSLALQDKYALLPRKNPRIAANELVAEAHANPRFQQVMRKAKTENGRSFWDEYKDIVAHIVAPGGAAAAVLSANPTFDKLLTAEEKPGA